METVFCNNSVVSKSEELKLKNMPAIKNDYDIERELKGWLRG